MARYRVQNVLVWCACAIRLSLTLPEKTASSVKFRVFAAQHLRIPQMKYLVNVRIHRPQYQGTCTASIIDKRHVITSAHCVIVPGIRTIYLERFERGETKTIAEVDLNHMPLHPEYVEGHETVFNRRVDFAILKTKEPIEFNSFVQPIPLAENAPDVSDKAFMTGYGESEKSMNSAKGGNVVVVDCPYLVPTLICTKNLTRAGDGDSGGALVFNNTLAGVTSGSCMTVHTQRPCLTVFANVAAHLDWIKQQIEK